MNRDELLKREERAWLTFVDAITAVPPERREIEGVVPGWSTHDVAWHCAYWAGYTADVLDRIRSGEPNPSDTAAPDDEVLATGRAMSWDDIVVQAEQNHERSRIALSALPELTKVAVEWFTDDTIGHYEEHATQIREFTP
ncbi:MAG: hypothetical protein OEV60_03410 [Actinomycetota bacterium]|nr:hypothetical protein [Actinomycetota bacterium]MDH5224852.1 hypothetical protein [Actinomycetota bacterium]MDH5312645.1 hypothetical protein [Actinomycetota bacterium]